MSKIIAPTLTEYLRLPDESDEAAFKKMRRELGHLKAVYRAAERVRLGRRPLNMPRSEFLRFENADLNASTEEARLHIALARARAAKGGR